MRPRSLRRYQSHQVQRVDDSLSPIQGTPSGKSAFISYDLSITFAIGRFGVWVKVFFDTGGFIDVT